MAVGLPSSVAVANGLALWIKGSNTVVSCPVTGCNGTPGVLAKTATARSLGVDAENAYWYEDFDRLIYRCSTNGCMGEPDVFLTDVYETYPVPPRVLVVAGPYLYYATDSKVIRVAQ